MIDEEVKEADALPSPAQRSAKLPTYSSRLGLVAAMT